METSARLSGTRDPMAAALLPVLLHRLNNVTQVISSLNSLLALGRGGDLLEERAEDLAASSLTIEELGWMLSVLASSCGADLLMERRKRRGMEPLFVAVREALRREGRDLELPAQRWPDLASAVHHGWELPWALGSWFFACAGSLPSAAPLSWRLERTNGGHDLVARCPLEGLSKSGVIFRIGELLPESRVSRRGEESVLSLPEHWLLDSEQDT